MNRDITANAAVFVIAAVFLYVIIMAISAARKKPITIYQVSKSDINNNIMADGLAIREEIVVSTPKSGYTCYYIRDGEKIKKNATLCTIDSTGKLYSSLEDTENFDELLTKQDYQDIRTLISLYKFGYSDVNFYDAYNFELDANSKVLELTNELLTKQANDSGVSLVTVDAPQSGLVTYYTDGFESYDPGQICASDFDKSKYNKRSLKSGEAAGSGDPIAKVIPSETWHIYVPMTDDQLSAVENEDGYVNFRINNSAYKIYMPYSVINGNDGKYLDITVNKYLTNFISERYLHIEFLLADETGLKVPRSSLVDKEIYKIPLNYFVAGEDTKHLEIEYVKKDGSRDTKDLVPTIYKKDDKYAYCDPNNFELTDVIINTETHDTIAVSLMETSRITGVYSANRGTAEFRIVTILKEIDEFALIKSNEMISPFDNIILNSDQVKENQVLY